MEYDQKVDEAIEGLDIEIPSEEDSPDQTDDELSTDDVETQSDEAEETTEEAPEDPLAKFNESKNPEDLPENMRDIIKGYQADFTRANQQSADRSRDAIARLEAKVELLSARAAPPAEEDAPPEVDFEATPEEMQRQMDARTQWFLAKDRETSREPVEAIEKKLAESERNAQIEGLTSYVRALPGHSDEVENKMAEAMAAHQDDPEWKVLMQTKQGLKMLHAEFVSKADATSGQEAKALAADKAKKSTVKRAGSRVASPLTDAERFAGLSTPDKIEKAVDEAIASV